MYTIKKELETYAELHWWNNRSKTLSYKGDLKGLLKKQGFRYTKRKTEHEGLFNFHFKNDYGISFKQRGLISDFSHLAKQALQMEFVRMGDKTQLYVDCTWRPTVSVNF
jgi:hypothetical protein